MAGSGIDLARFLARHGATSSQDFARAFDVSERTVRAYVLQANERLGSILSVERDVEGRYRLEVTDRQAFERLLGDARDRMGAIPRDKDERVLYIENDLLARNDWVTIDQLADVLFVSRRTLSDDLKAVEERLDRFGLVLERRSHCGIRVTGSEMSRRLCLADTVIAASIGKEASPVDVPELHEVAACVDAALRDSDIQVASIAYQNLLVHLAVAIARIRMGSYVPMERESLARIEASGEYATAEGIARAISNRFGISLPREEVAYITIHLAGRRLLNMEGDEGDTGLVISDDVWKIVSEMLEAVWHTFRFDFRNDLELRMSLGKHIVPLSVRLQYNLKFGNPLLADIKTRFPLAYSMASDASGVLARRYGVIPSESEIGYIALSFALALDRQKTQLKKMNVLIVCASGAGSARLLEQRCREEFGECLGRVELCDVSRFSRFDFTGIDAVFTTVPLPSPSPVPVREIHVFLDKSDVDGMRRLLKSGSVPASIERFFSPDLFFPHRRFDGKKAALAWICEQMIRTCDLPGNLLDLVLERERMAPTAFGNRVALPHPMQTVGTRTAVAVCLLDAPLDWGTCEVEAIFLISVAAGEGEDLSGFYERMSDVLMDQEAVARLVQEQTYGNLLRVVCPGAELGGDP